MAGKQTEQPARPGDSIDGKRFFEMTDAEVEKWHADHLTRISRELSARARAMGLFS